MLAVVYGRRRCGKSTLLEHVLRSHDVYFHADQRERPLQIQALAEAVDAVLPDFSAASYSAWDAVLTSLSQRVPDGLTICIDEFPYLVQSAPELPSVLQRFVDRPDRHGVSWFLCGSSQRMMQGAVLDKKAPLYGRAHEILIGEVKWTASRVDLKREASRLKDLAPRLPFVGKRKPVFAVWTGKGGARIQGVEVLRPDDVLALLR